MVKRALMIKVVKMNRQFLGERKRRIRRRTRRLDGIESSE